MKILIDIGHPAHVHLFKHFAWEMQGKGHEIFFTCREKEFEIELLKHYGFDYKSFGRKYGSAAGKAWGLIKFGIQEYIAGLKFKPDILMSHSSMYAAQASFLLRKPHIAMEDTGNWEQVKLYLPFTEAVLTPKVLSTDLGRKQIRYDGYHELAYLHPNRHRLENVDSHLPKKFVLLRFVAWKASHDYGQTGFTDQEKSELVGYLISRGYDVLISSEGKLTEKLEKYRYASSPEKMHTILSYAQLYIGEGATMASEAAVLGVPSIYVNSIPSSICNDQETYGLVYNFRSYRGILDRVNEVFSIPDHLQEFRRRREKMLADKIDVTDLMVWFVGNYPDSLSMVHQRLSRTEEKLN